MNGEGPTEGALGRALAPFRAPAYRRLAVSLVASSFASGVWVIAVVWEVIRLGGGPGTLSVVTTAGSVGVLLPALVAGVVADRIPQRTILLAVGVVELASFAVVAALSALDQNSVAALSSASFAVGMAMSFYYPAYTALLPALVPESALQAVNGFEGMVRPTIGQALGPAVAGAVVAAASPGAAFTVAAVASAVTVAAVLRVPRTDLRRTLDPEHATHPIRSALRDMGEGLGYLRRTPWLLGTLVFASLMILTMMGPLEVLVPFLIKDQLGGGPRDHAWVLAGFGLGGAAGSLLMASVRMPRRYLTVMNLGWGLACLPFLLIGSTTRIGVVIACAVVMGALFAAPGVIWGTLLQRRVPPELLGRVSSLDFFVSILLMPVSMALAGPVSELIGLQTTFAIAGTVPLVVAVVVVLWARLPQDELAHPLG